jgi:membrane protein
MNKILGIVFLLATILIGMISNGKIKLDNIWVILIFILQIASWIGYINLLDIEKRYKLWLSILSVCAVFIIGFFYILK